jgi:hypothetical protein
VNALASSSRSTISPEELNSVPCLTAAQLPSARLVDSLEVRWFVPGRLGVAARDWFGRFPAGTEAGEDAYLICPRLDGLSVKLREGGRLDVKSYLGTPGILGLRGCGLGRLESWRKRSFACAAPDSAGAMPPGWVTVRKARRSIWFPLSAGQGGASPRGQAPLVTKVPAYWGQSAVTRSEPKSDA